MPKTIAITPSWYWPERVDRVAGIPPYALQELCVERHGRRRPEEIALLGGAQAVSWHELQRRTQEAARGVAVRAGASNTVVLGNELSADNIALLLGALTAGANIRIAGATENPEEVASAIGAAVVTPDLAFGAAGEEDTTPVAVRRPVAAPAVTIPGAAGPVTHSHRSLLAMAVSLTTFLEPLPDAPWLSALPLDRWEGLTAALIPLYKGVPLVAAQGLDGESMLAQVAEQRPGYALLDLDEATLATREARRGVRRARDVLAGMIVCTSGVFDPGDRQRVGKAYRCPALTMYGLPETGPIFASHPQWYIDESVGIPVTNAHVVPSDPRDGEPIQALWEQVESAEVTVQGPMLMCHEEEGAKDRFVGARYRTGVIASSDANGMIYLLPD